MKPLLDDLATRIASVCEHKRIDTSVASYIDPRIIYKFLLDNGILEFESVFFQPKQIAKNAWAHPSNYDYILFDGY